MAGIYVHIPFCHSKCAYCDFYSLASTSKVRDYAAAVSREWSERRHEIDKLEIGTIYFGGGTPSILPHDVFTGIAGLFPTEDVREFTIEVNPEDVTSTNVKVWKAAGVNRVSMGIQSLVDDELRLVGRRHSAQEALDAIRILKEGGISNISCDLIYGLPGQTLDSWNFSLDNLLGCGISHLSAYSLSYEPGTRLYLMLQRGQVREADDALSEAMYHSLCVAAMNAGMKHYEISNFALPGLESAHNSSYWTGIPYLGLGPGAHSLDADGVRRYVPGSLRSYLEAPESSAIVDPESEIEKVNDRIMLGLRTSAGLDMDAFSEGRKSEILKNAAHHIKAGRLALHDTLLTIPEEYWLVSDMIIRDLFFEDD